MYPMFVGGLTVAAIVYSLTRIISVRRTEHYQIEQGILLTVHIKRIIDCCQRHRGISNSVNQGNNKLKPQLLSLQSDIDRLIRSNESDALGRFPQWQSFIEHWPRLKKHIVNGDLPSRNLVRQHSLMIDGQLSMLDDVMRYHNLHKMMLDRYMRVSEVCLDTLRVAETIGQSRAIGSGICAHGVCEGADKITLDFLRISVASTTAQLLKEVDAIDNSAIHNALVGASSAIKNSTNKLLVMVQQDVLVEGKLQIKPDDYFAASTQAIDDVMKVFGIIMHYASQQHTRLV